MILVIDVGNTNTEIGVFKDDEILCSWRFVSKTPRTSDEYAVMFQGFFENDHLDYHEVESVIAASVVPNIMYSLNNGVKKLFNVEPLVVGPGIKTGMPI